MSDRKVSGTKDLSCFMKQNENIKYFIPEYQREYVWGQNEVSYLISDFIDSSAPKKSIPHFIGTVTRCKIINPESDCIEANLIDGQQRFTTMLLFVHSIKTVLCREFTSADKGFNDLYRRLDRILFANPDTEEPRLVPNELNRDYYFDVVSSYYSNSNTITKDKMKGTQNEALERAFYTIHDKIMSIYKKENSIACLQELFEKITTDLEFTVIEVKEIKDAPTIFETLNFRGKELQACEIIKNRILSNLSSDPMADSFINKWVEVSRNLKTSSRFDEYIRYVFIATQGPTSEKALKDNVLDNWINRDSRKTKEFISILHENYKVYLYFTDKEYLGVPFNLSKSSITHIREKIDWLRDDYLRNDYCKPFRPAIIKANILSKGNPDPIYEIAFIGFNFFFRKMAIMGDKLNKFNTELNSTTKNSTSCADLKRNLSSMFIRHASDSDFKKALKAFKFKKYSQSKNNLGYTMIWRYESQSFSSSLYSVKRSNVDVEHIFPQKHKNWEDDIRKGLISVSASNNDLLKLGNLILLENNLNKSVGANYYEDKVQTLKSGKTKIRPGKFSMYQNGRPEKGIPPTSFNEARLVAKNKKWGTREIDNRTSEIINGSKGSASKKGLVDLFPIS